jgi:hypothetical protein
MLNNPPRDFHSARTYFRSSDHIVEVLDDTLADLNVAAIADIV